jgi:hypothetical protein
MDVLLVEALAETLNEKEIEGAIDGYLEIIMMLDGGLKQQVELDLDSLKRATGRELTDGEQEEFISVQQQAIRWTFLGSGMTHKNFLATLEDISPTARSRVEELSPTYC